MNKNSAILIVLLFHLIIIVHNWKLISLKFTPREQQNPNRKLKKLSRYLRESNFSSIYDESNTIVWPRKAILGKIYHDVKARYSRTVPPSKPEIVRFIGQRDMWRNDTGNEDGLELESQCGNCSIDATCYNSSLNLWHPSRVSVVNFVSYILSGSLGTI